MTLNRRKSVIFAVVIFVVLTMAFGLLPSERETRAYGETYKLTTGEQVAEFLSNLEAGNYYMDTIIIDGSAPIDCGGIAVSPLSFLDLKDKYIGSGEGADVVIQFNTQLTNINFYEDGFDWETSPHHGLFTLVEKCTRDEMTLSVYYKVNLNVGNGTLAENLTKYRYSEETELPNVTPSEGETFLGWQEEGTDTIVTKISDTSWGVKTYNAVYENVSSGGDAEQPDNENTPTTYPIVYNDSLGSSSLELLNTTYTIGEELMLGSLEKEGFVFVGWESNGAMVTKLDAELQQGLLSDDGKIYLEAVWELESPTLSAQNGISKVYDGQDSILKFDIEHSLLGELSFDYKWYKKGSLDVVSTQDGIAFCNVESSEYMLELTAEHPSSGLGKKVASEYVSVVISAKEISVQKLEGDYDLSKTYDTTKTFVGDVAKDVHYQLDGIVLGDDVAVESVFAEYVSAQVGNTTLSVTFEGITGADASNYTFSGALLNYDTLISAKAVSLKKLSSPNLNKEYDGTTDVAYAFERGVDFELVGVLEEIECVCSAKYSVASVGESKVVLSVEINNLNYSLSLSTLEFDATIGKKELVPIKLSSPNISKIYDGTKSTFYNFTYAVDFTMSGAIDGEIKSVGYTAFYDSANVIASKVVLIVGEIEFNDGASLDNYEYVSNAYDLYFDASITPREIALSGQDFVREYEESENLVDTIVTGVGAESIKVRYIRESGNVVGEYAYIGVEFVAPVNSNYALKFVPDGKIYKIIPSVPIIVFPTFESRDYSESVTLKDEVLIDDTNYQKETDGYVHKMGVFRWAQPSIVANANDEVGYDMVFAPNDTINYDYSSVEGFDQNTKNVTRKVVLTIFKATPTPTPIADSFVIPIGMRYNKLALGEKWSIVESDLLTSSSVASGEENQTVTFENALVYEHDDSGNYHKVYKDLVVSFVLPKIVFKNGENSAEGNQVEVIRNLNGSIAIRIALQNPFAKEGYKVSEWTLADGTKIYSNGADTQTYDLLSPDLVKLTIAIEVNMVARDDVRVEFRHYYENLSGGYDDENVEVALVFGTANVTRGISYSDLKVKKGFSFTKATLTESEESIENFVVSPSGDTVVLFYYVRKTIMVNYVDTLYCELPHEGALPETKEVKYGVPFGIGQPLNYLVYGYNFVGYTDGVTMEDGALKVISDVEYVVTDDIESVTFTLRLAPSTNTLYIINRYVGDECVSEKHYGTTGASIDITNVEYVGHDRYAHENEKLKGVISGNVVDEDGNVIKGEVLTLAVYYKVESYIITLPSEVDGDFLTAEFGKEIILPSAPEQQEGKEFLGWVINGVLYSAVESFVMPASDVVITARWQDEVADGEGNVGSGAEDESTSTDESESTAEVLSSGAIIGIVAGTAALIVIVAIISAVVTKRQKKRQELIYKLQEVNRNMFND